MYYLFNYVEEEKQEFIVCEECGCVVLLDRENMTIHDQYHERQNKK